MTMLCSQMQRVCKCKVLDFRNENVIGRIKGPILGDFAVNTKKMVLLQV